MLILTHDIKTFYDYDTNTLSRTVGNKLHHVDLKGKTDIKEVHRLVQLDNENFALLSELQANRRRRQDASNYIHKQEKRDTI